MGKPSSFLLQHPAFLFDFDLFLFLCLFICLFFAEELQKQLLEQVELRKKLEREFQHLKGKLISATVHVKANVPPLCD